MIAVVLLLVGVVAAVWKQDISFLLPAACVFFPGLLLAGAANTFSEVPLAAFACVAFAPSALFPGFFPQFQRLPVKTRITLAVISLLIPCAAGIAMAVRYESLDFG